MTMSTEAEQRVVAAARLQLTWHYARLLTTAEYRREALLRHDAGPHTAEEVTAIQAELAVLDSEIFRMRMDAEDAGVLRSELDRVLASLDRERRLVATLVAAELREPGAAHASWPVPGEIT